MKRIIFVDDEPAVLDGLQRSLRKQQKDWDMHFAQSGMEALGKLENGQFDAIVTDVRMPGMDGAELLGEVVKRYPDMVRIVLTGHSDRREVLQSGTLANQYLMKPADPEMLLEFVGTQIILNSLTRPKAAPAAAPVGSYGAPAMPKGFDVNDALRAAINKTKGEWEGVGEVATDFDTTLPRMPHLEFELPMVLLNLMVNAAHAIGESFERTGSRGRINVRTRKAGDSIELQVSDTGPGMTDAIRAKAFEWIGKETLRSGPGPWLVLAHAIITDKGGGITVDSQVGKGSTYTVRLPITPATRR